MSNNTQGQYQTILLDKDDAVINTINAGSFCDADDLGQQCRKEGLCHTYAIARILFNSSTPNLHNYDVRPKA
jgi:hypothetical protein